MGTIKSTVWQLEPHTRAKHQILRRYLAAWFPIMGKFNKRIVFIDGFAGPGAYANGEDGSPIVALNTATQHSNPLWRELVIVFIEGDHERYVHLKGKLDEYQLPATVKVIHNEGRFDEHMTSILSALEGDRSRMAPTFAFIDPFGFSHTPMSVIKRIMRNDKCEVFITFMYEEINRFITHPDPRIGAHYDELFGTTAWRTYIELGTPQARKQSIMDLYVSQLQTQAGIRYVSKCGDYRHRFNDRLLGFDLPPRAVPHPTVV